MRRVTRSMKSSSRVALFVGQLTTQLIDTKVITRTGEAVKKVSGRRAAQLVCPDVPLSPDVGVDYVRRHDRRGHLISIHRQRNVLSPDFPCAPPTTPHSQTTQSDSVSVSDTRPGRAGPGRTPGRAGTNYRQLHRWKFPPLVFQTTVL